MLASGLALATKIYLTGRSCHPSISVVNPLGLILVPQMYLKFYLLLKFPVSSIFNMLLIESNQCSPYAYRWRTETET